MRSEHKNDWYVESVLQDRRRIVFLAYKSTENNSNRSYFEFILSE